MKKIFPIVVVSLCLAGCSQVQLPNQSGENTGTVLSWTQGNVTGPLLSDKISAYTANWQMQKPTLTGMKNRDAIVHGFSQPWTNSYVFDKETIQADKENWQKYCKSGITVYDYTNSQNLKKILPSAIKPGFSVEIKGIYQSDGLGIDISTKQQSFLQNHGWVITEVNSGFLESLQNSNPYDPEGSMIAYNEEWTNAYGRLGGSPIDYKRYPYNTLLVTSDLVLHLYHKLFDNSLKSYEETTARPIMADFAQQMLDKFAILSKKEKNTELKRYYDFLEAYWIVPSALLIPQQEIEKKLVDPQMGYDGSADLSNDEIKNMIQQRTKTILAGYPNPYHQAIQESIEAILKGTDNQNNDRLLSGFIGPFDPTFFIKQDYTQFVPRSHYTDSSLLKTYFMGMKWLMREKLYFSKTDLAKAGLIMTNNITDKDLEKVNLLQEFVKKIIGQDDDVNVQDMKTFAVKNDLKTDATLLQNFNESLQKNLFVLRPQKIISTSYNTPQEGAVTESEAKDQTAGFVFFGEKFTIDSWIFDQLTAGSAEKESDRKPRVQSSLSVLDTLAGTPRTTELMKEWFQKNTNTFGITPTQINAYPEIKEQTRAKVAELFSTGTIYGQWIDMLSWNLVPTKNAPYFVQDTGYQDKQINTYLGSYTELKHDTLLYVKQAYAEMGGGGPGSCEYAVMPPALPVPKGYVEPNIDVIDRVLDLTQETSRYFTGPEYAQFVTYLQFIKTMAVAEINNQKISDEDFDKFRLRYQDLSQILQPKKVFGMPSAKEFRSAIIADIFTSGKYGPLYLATGRPHLMLVMVNDINGPRVVIGPVYSTYEFYGNPIPSAGGRYTDDDWQSAYDSLTGKDQFYSLPLSHLLEQTK